MALTGGCASGSGRAGRCSQPTAPAPLPASPALPGSQPTRRGCAALPPSRCPWALASWASFSLSLVYLVFALRWMTGAGACGAGRGCLPSRRCLEARCRKLDLRRWWVRVCAGIVLDLFCVLNPALKRRQLDTFHWAKLWAGFYLNNAGGRRAGLGGGDGPAGPLAVLMAVVPTPTAAPQRLPLRGAVIPVCIAYTFLTRHIDWSGIRYWRKGGRIIRVLHSYQS